MKDWPGGWEAWSQQEPINAHSHLLAMLVGNSEYVAVADSKLCIGQWQSILLVRKDTDTILPLILLPGANGEGTIVEGMPHSETVRDPTRLVHCSQSLIDEVHLLLNASQVELDGSRTRSLVVQITGQ